MGRGRADSGGGGAVPSLGERAGRDPRGPDHRRREVARGIGARGLVGGGRRRGPGSHSARAQPREERPVGSELCGRGSFPGPRRGRPAAVGHRLAWRLSAVGKASGLEGLLWGTRALEPGSAALCSPPPTPFSFRNPGLPSSCSPPPPRLRRVGLPGAPPLPSHLANGASPSSHQKTPL